MDSNEGFDMKSCRICSSTKKPLCPLFRYKLSGNYAEMLTAIADVKVWGIFDHFFIQFHNSNNNNSYKFDLAVIIIA